MLQTGIGIAVRPGILIEAGLDPVSPKDGLFHIQVKIPGMNGYATQEFLEYCGYTARVGSDERVVILPSSATPKGELGQCHIKVAFDKDQVLRDIDEILEGLDPLSKGIASSIIRRRLNVDEE